MARRAQRPFRNKERWVEEVYRYLWKNGYTAEEAYEKFHRLRRNSKQAQAQAIGFPVDLPPHQSRREQHSLDTVKNAWAVWNRESLKNTGMLPGLWDFLANPLSHQPQALAAIAAWQRLSGEPWPVSQQEAEALDRIFTCAPDLPPVTAASLAQQLVRWEDMRPEERQPRLATLRDFLGFAPWRGEREHQAYMAWVNARDKDFIQIQEDGTARYSVVFVGVGIGSGIVVFSTASMIAEPDELDTEKSNRLA